MESDRHGNRGSMAAPYLALPQRGKQVAGDDLRNSPEGNRRGLHRSHSTRVTTSRPVRPPYAGGLRRGSMIHRRERKDRREYQRCSTIFGGLLGGSDHYVICRSSSALSAFSAVFPPEFSRDLDPIRLILPYAAAGSGVFLPKRYRTANNSTIAPPIKQTPRTGRTTSQAMPMVISERTAAITKAKVPTP